MSGIFQGYANSDGRVRASQVTEVPAGSANDRGMVVAGNRVIPYLVDAGQPRTFHDGIAFDNVTGLLLVGDGTATPLNTAMGGLLVDVNGAVVAEAVAPDVIHQGVGLGNDGRLAIEAEPIATFIAHLRNNVASTTGPGAFTRESEGLYLGADGNWRIASDNVPRFENGQLLMEPAITNKCAEYNANPDGALSGFTITGAGILTRELRPDLIAAAGLQNICTSGYVFHFTSTAASDCITSGDTGNTNQHRVSSWIYSISGITALLLQGDTGNAVTITPNGGLVRYNAFGVPTSTTRSLMIRLPAAGECYFVLQQLEESPVPTSPIITQGAAGVRAADALSYVAGVDVFNQSEGMALLTFRVPFDLADNIIENNSGLLSVNGLPNSLIYCGNIGNANTLTLFSFTGTNTYTGPTIDVAENDVLYAAIRWTGGNSRQLGLRKNSEAWAWATPQLFTFDWAVDGTLNVGLDNREPRYYENLQLYNEDKGTSWIEANYP